MIAPSAHDDFHAHEIARGLATAVHAAVAAARSSGGGARKLAWDAAADVAELLQLQGLAALLAACEAHAGAPPLAVTNTLERLERLAMDTEAQGDITPFATADRELGALAGMLAAQDWTPPTEEEPTPVPVQGLGELLTDFAVDDADAIARTQVTLPVAAGLRAVLDWLGADAGGPLRVTVHDAALTLATRVTHEPGLGPAGAVLGLMGGALLPEPDGRWSVRVPLHTLRPAFLLARQGELSLALPWHAVARLRIADDAARAVMTEPSLAPWSPLSRTHGERPVVLLAQGLTRAWLHLDHIVWRVFARPEPAAGPMVVPGARLAVRPDEGGEFWVVDAAEALRGVPQLHTPPPGNLPRHSPAATAPAMAAEPAASIAHAAPAPPAPAVETLPEREPEPALLVLTAEHVHPLTLTPRPAPTRDVAPAPQPVASPPPAPPPEPAPAPRLESFPERLPEPAVLDPHDAQPLVATPQATKRRRALIVDDSLVARIALARVLEREGWVVEGVERASEMWTALQSDDWTVVFVDVFLPDASGRAHLRALVARQLTARRRFEVVALTRDGAEQRLVDDAGITRTLRKPFATGAVEGMIRELSRTAAGT